MTENWFSILSQLAIGLAWPVAILALAFLFRKAIRPRFKEVREVKNPDGSTIMDGSDLSESIAKSRKDEIKRS